MNKRVLLSVGIIITVASLTFLVTRAFFSDTETGTGSTFTMGTLELQVDGGAVVAPFVVDNIGEHGDVEGGHVWTITNSGSLPGRLYFAIDNLANWENDCNKPESRVDSSCGNPGQGEGELGETLNVAITLDGQEVVSSDFSDVNQDKIGTDWRALAPVVIPAGESVDVAMLWSASGDDYGNEIQSDSVTFDTVFTLEQLVDEQI
ncbi:MAG: TasA family protein [Candidatus Shapirobacteria bacterium]|nr:TasA family protein [Candidatus Shapirobacteria bacterium]